jgi:mRNA-degrading endonuclease toxin of MazEF toxin-antitoxin module/transcriptional regulator with XRE-family HTH domain
VTDNDKKIRLEILAAMAEKGLRQAPLARRLGITPQSLNQVIKGDRAVLPTSLTAVLEELGLELVVRGKDDEGAVDNLDEDALLASGTADLQAALDKLETKLPPDYADAWLDAFQITGVRPDVCPRGSIVLVQFDHPAGRGRKGKTRPCVIVTDARSGRRIRESRAPLMYGVVPLAASSKIAVGKLAPRLTASAGGLPANCMALCVFVCTVAPERIVGYVSQLNDHDMWKIEEGLQHLYEIPWVMPENWIKDRVLNLLYSSSTDSELRREMAELYRIDLDEL